MNRQQRRAAERESRRMASPAMRREIGRRTFQQLNQMSMDHTQSRDLLVFALAALDAVTRGEATDVDLNNLAVISNISLLLCERGYGANVLDDVIAAQHVVVSMRERFDRTSRVGVDGPGLQRLRDLMDIHGQQLEAQPTRQEMLGILSTMRQRMSAGHVMGAQS